MGRLLAATAAVVLASAPWIAGALVSWYYERDRETALGLCAYGVILGAGIGVIAWAKV